MAKTFSVKKHTFEQNGQVLLVVLLIMVVGLTIGLSLATRSVSDVKISSQMENSARAFSAAEGGVEAALKGETPPPSPIPIGNASYIFTKNDAGGTGNPLPLGKIGQADTYNIWLVWHKSDGSLDFPGPYTVHAPYAGSSVDVCWGESGGETPIPAMEVSVVYQDGSEYKVVRGAYDPDSTRAAGNHFTNSFSDNTLSGRCGGGFSYGRNVPLPSGKIPIVLRLRPFYLDPTNNPDTLIGVAPVVGETLPGQGINIVSTGTSGDTTRKVSVVQAYPALPAIFDYVLFSGTGVTKNP